MNNYSDLLIKQYQGSSKNKNFINTLTTIFRVDDLNKLLLILDTEQAKGIDLDLIGGLVGQDRLLDDYGDVPYFGFSKQQVNKAYLYNKLANYEESGRWFNKYGKLKQYQALDDIEYRKMIKLKILKNTSVYTVKTLAQAINIIFGYCEIVETFRGLEVHINRNLPNKLANYIFKNKQYLPIGYNQPVKLIKDLNSDNI